MRNFVFLVPPSSVEDLLASGEIKLELAFAPEETDVWDDTDTPEVSVSHARWRLGHVLKPRNPQTWASANLSGQLDERHRRKQSAGEHGDGQHSVRQLGRDWSGEVGLIDRIELAPASTSEIRPKQYFLEFSVSVHCATKAVK